MLDYKHETMSGTLQAHWEDLPGELTLALLGPLQRLLKVGLALPQLKILVSERTDSPFQQFTNILKP